MQYITSTCGTHGMCLVRAFTFLLISKIQPNTKVRDRNPSPSKGTYDSAAVYTLQAIHESTLMPEGKSRKDFRYLLFMVIGHCNLGSD